MEPFFILFLNICQLSLATSVTPIYAHATMVSLMEKVIVQSIVQRNAPLVITVFTLMDPYAHEIFAHVIMEFLIVVACA